MESLTIHLSPLINVFLFTTLSFIVGILLTPFFTDFLYQNRLGKRIRRTDFAGERAPIYAGLHKGKENTPTMGGLLIWIPAAIITILFNLSRAGTWLPLFTLVLCGAIGAFDDILNVLGRGPHRGGMRFGFKFILYGMVAAIGAWWFYSKLGWSIIHLPGVGNFEIGFWYVPIFILVLVGLAFCVNETDGLDGLAGGVLATSYAAYGVIALSQQKAELAIFCFTILGLILAFLWFNIYPARFFMGDTGAMALGMTLGVIAFLTNAVLPLFVIGFVFFADGGSAVLQIISKKILHRKIFISAPVHHHFEALGWPETKVTQRFWLISAICAAIGLAIALIGRG